MPTSVCMVNIVLNTMCVNVKKGCVEDFGHLKYIMFLPGFCGNCPRKLFSWFDYLSDWVKECYFYLSPHLHPLPSCLTLIREVGFISVDRKNVSMRLMSLANCLIQSHQQEQTWYRDKTLSTQKRFWKFWKSQHLILALQMGWVMFQGTLCMVGHYTFHLAVWLFLFLDFFWSNVSKIYM